MFMKDKKRKKLEVKVRRNKMGVGRTRGKRVDVGPGSASVNDYISSLRMTPKTYVDKLQEIVKNHDVMIMDSGAEVSILGRAFKRINRNVDTRATLSPYGNQGADSLELINGVSTVVDLLDRPIACLQVNQAAYKPSERESLLNMDHVNLCGQAEYVTKQDPAMFSTLRDVKGEWVCPLFFDGRNEFLRLRYPKDLELRELPLYVITSPKVFRPEEALVNVLKKNIKKGKRPQNRGLKARKTRRVIRRNATKDFYHEWCLRLGCTNQATVDATFQATTQLVPSVKAENSMYPKKIRKNRFPFLRPRYLDEECSTDTIEVKSNSPGAYRYMQVYFYHKSRFTVAYPMTRKSQFVDTVKLLFTEHGVPTRLRSDGAREELRSEKVQSYLTTYFCASGKSEAGNQHQNRGERWIQDLKARARRLLEVSQAPKKRLGYLLQYICVLWNHTANRELKGKTPIEHKTGDTPDISWCRFKFWEPVWYLDASVPFPESRMLKGRFLGLDIATGDEHTYFILTSPDDAEKRQTVISRRVVCPRSPGEHAYAANPLRESDHFFPPGMVNPWRKVHTESVYKRSYFS